VSYSYHTEVCLIPYPVALRRSSDEELYAPLTIFNPVTQHLNLGHLNTLLLPFIRGTTPIFGWAKSLPPSPLPFHIINTIRWPEQFAFWILCVLLSWLFASVWMRVRANHSRELSRELFARIIRVSVKRPLLRHVVLTWHSKIEMQRRNRFTLSSISIMWTNECSCGIFV